MTCDGQSCLRYRAKKPKTSRYSDGQSHCGICEIWIYWEGVRCPCCSTILRKHPRAMKYKDKLRETGIRQVGIDYEQLRYNESSPFDSEPIEESNIIATPIDLPMDEIA